jgi:hypothetical protein
MQGSGQAFCLIAICVSLCACLVWALCEIEDRRQRHRQRAELVRDAMRFVVTRTKARG